MGKATYDVTDVVEPPVDVQADGASVQADGASVQADGASVQTINKRMGRHAANFYLLTNISSAVKTNECETTNASVL